MARQQHRLLSVNTKVSCKSERGSLKPGAAAEASQYAAFICYIYIMPQMLLLLLYYSWGGGVWYNILEQYQPLHKTTIYSLWHHAELLVTAESYWYITEYVAAL